MADPMPPRRFAGTPLSSVLCKPERSVSGPALDSVRLPMASSWIWAFSLVAMVNKARHNKSFFTNRCPPGIDYWNVSSSEGNVRREVKVRLKFDEIVAIDSWTLSDDRCSRFISTYPQDFHAVFCRSSRLLFLNLNGWI